MQTFMNNHLRKNHLFNLFNVKCKHFKFTFKEEKRKKQNKKHKKGA